MMFLMVIMFTGMEIQNMLNRMTVMTMTEATMMMVSMVKILAKEGDCHVSFEINHADQKD